MKNIMWLISFHIHTWQMIQFKTFLVHIIRCRFFVLKKNPGKSRTAVYVDVRSCFRHFVLFLLDFLSHTWQFVVYISHHHVGSIMNILWLISYHIHAWQIIQFISFSVHIIRYSFFVREWGVGKAFDWVLLSRMRPGYMVVDVVVQNPPKSNMYEYEKKRVRRDSKMCCCCCYRICCGAPTTDKRIHAPVLHRKKHAPVLHEASQIVYCR